MKYGFIQQHSNYFCVTHMCSLLMVSRSGYYDFLKHKPSKREVENKILDNNIKSIFNEHKSRYGAPRINRVLMSMGSHMAITELLKE